MGKFIDKVKQNECATHPLQTWEWGEFRKAWGNEVEQFPFGLITIHKIPFTNYKIGIFEKGPIPTKDQLEELKRFGKKENIIFIKLEPNIAEVRTAKREREKTLKLLQKYCVKGRRLFTPETLWIDLTKSEEDLLKGFSPKTRYNIRVAQKHGVEVSEDNSEAAFKKYLELTFATAKRQGFFAHTPKYHRLMWKYLHQNLVETKQIPIAHLLTAKYKGEILTTWIVFVWKDFLYYPYGASSVSHREVMANNLMMWEAIRFGKKMDCKTFDLWGREEGKGFTRFKEGYNPEVIKFIGTWDLLINKPVYRLYRLAENIRWLLLRIRSKVLIK
jgi:lipid II:glycine glycyltransferase (peptidoglycan interpeptide bridge formation enzyme)